MARPLLWQPRSLLCQITCVTVAVQHATRLARLSVPLARWVVTHLGLAVRALAAAEDAAAATRAFVREPSIRDGCLPC